MFWLKVPPKWKWVFQSFLDLLLRVMDTNMIVQYILEKVQTVLKIFSFLKRYWLSLLWLPFSEGSTSAYGIKSPLSSLFMRTWRPHLTVAPFLAAFSFSQTFLFSHWHFPLACKSCRAHMSVDVLGAWQESRRDKLFFVWILDFRTVISAKIVDGNY